MRSEAKEWLKIAEEELRAADHLFEVSLYRMVCYHAQQENERVVAVIQKPLICRQCAAYRKTASR